MVQLSASGQVLFPSLARTADANVELKRPGSSARGFILLVDCTVDPASASVVPTVQIQHPVTGDWHTLITFAAFAATGDFEYLLYPGTIAADFDGNDAVSMMCPEFFRILFDHADGDSITYSASIHPLL